MGVRSLYQVGSFSTVSLYTATLLFLIGLGILAARPTRGFMATLMCDDLGGVMLRRMLPLPSASRFLPGGSASPRNDQAITTSTSESPWPWLRSC